MAKMSNAPQWMRLASGTWMDGGNEVKAAPVQVTRFGMPLTVPWEISEEAYKEYAERYGTSQSHERICDRSGFSVEELAVLLYGRIKRLEAQAAAMEKGLADVKTRSSVRMEVVSFFASVIKSGEKWTGACEDALRKALEGK